MDKGYADFVARVAVNQARLSTLQDRLIHALHALQAARVNFPPELEVEEATVAVEEAGIYERLVLNFGAK